MKQFLVLGCMAVLCFSGCGGKDKPVARIGQDKITLGMVEERIQEAPPSYQNYLTTSAGRKQFLDLMVRERVVMEAARQAGIKKGSEYKKAMSDFEKEQVRRQRDYEENLLMELYVRDLHEKQIGTTDAEVETYYKDHKKEYERPVEIVARHILVQTRPEAENVLKRIAAKEDFARIAREVSCDPVSAARGGEIGPFRKGDLVQEFEAAVFPLKNNEVSGIIETQFGYHIIKKVSQKPLPALSVEDAKMEIKKVLEKAKFDSWLEQTKKKYKVTVDYSLLSGAQSDGEGDDFKPASEAK